MHILFVCRFLPHAEARDSGRLDTFHYITSLSQKHKVSVITFVTEAEKDAVSSLINICENVIAVPYYENRLSSRLWRLAWRLLLPKTYGRVISLSYRKTLKDLVSNTSFDAAVVHGMMAPYGSLLGKMKLVLDEVDVFFMVAHTIYQNEMRMLSRLRSKWDWLRTAVYESKYINDFDAVAVRSLKDKVIIQELHPQKNIIQFPPWFEGLEELQDIPISRPDDNVILFMGAMNIPPNIEAVTYFAEDVFPLIKERISDVNFYIVGAHPVPIVKALSQLPGVIVTGEVSDLKPFYEKAALIVSPLFTGGGIIVKTLNGLASGRPVVATNIGNSGTGAQDREDIYIVSSVPTQFAQAVINILRDEHLWYRLAQNGRSFIKKIIIGLVLY